MKLSVTIIALNEEENIERAIRSVSFADEVIVVDSLGTDKTAEIANSLGAKVYQNKFVGYGQQKNWAEEKAEGPWILSIDADEEVSPRLAEAIQQIVKNHLEGAPLVYKMNRRTKFVDKWIYHGGWYPDWLARLYLKGSTKWTEPEVHEKLMPLAGSSEVEGQLPGDLNHYSFPTIAAQINTNIKYAGLGAKALRSNPDKSYSLLHLIFKPIGKFLECYIIKRGFLDGKEGFIIAINATHSLFMKYSIALLDSEND
jgi:glycosyltransferase involved in cell wall biosynthesis